MTKCIALVVAAGRGTRFGADRPKQYNLLGGVPLLRHSLLRLCHHPKVAQVCVVIHPDDRSDYALAAADLEVLPPIYGGANRQESVLRGLESLEKLQPDQVLIHDGARPYPPVSMIDRLLTSLREFPGVVPALAIADSLKQQTKHATLRAGPERESLMRVQTPQAFHYQPILAAHRAALDRAESDDAAVAERAGLSVTWVPGSEENFKVTTIEDLALAEALLSLRQEVRTGLGYDVHAFKEGSHVTLCGVRIPHDRGLQGHSDADVGLHALTDALLGAMAAGDIGEHFPPSDPRWKDADSAAFLAHSGDLLRERRGVVKNLDVTLICEAPRLAPYRAAMRARVAEILELEPERISIKATTSEGLGFTGRREGIAAHALATITLPA